MKKNRGFTLVELMIIVALVGILISVGPNLLLTIFRFWRMQIARVDVSQNARKSLDLVNRTLRQGSASTITISNRPNQPPYSWIQFSVDKGTGPVVGSYAYYQEGKNLNYVKDGSTTTLADNLRFLAFTYPQSDDTDIIAVAMTFEEATYAGQTKALQLSIEKVRVMN